MLSENRLERKTLGQSKKRDRQVRTDKQNASNNDVLTTAITVGMIALGGKQAYKAGLLEPIAKFLFELGDTVAKEGSDRASSVMKTVGDWAKLDTLTPDKLRKSKYHGVKPPEDSLFRERETTLFEDIYETVKDSKDTGRIDNYKIKKILSDTYDDIANLGEMIQKNIDNLENERHDYTRTRLNFVVNAIRDRDKVIGHYSPRQRHWYNATIMSEFLDEFTLTQEQAAADLKRTGYRALTLGDIMEKYTDENGHERLRLKEDEWILSQINIDEKINADGRTLYENINVFLQQEGRSFVDASGKKRDIFASGEWENIVIDSAIRVDQELGQGLTKEARIIDYRMSKQNSIDFMHSLANDFKLPLVQFNPFKSLGFDKIGRQDPFVGLIHSEQVDPNLTHKGGRVKVGEWLAEEYGEEYRNVNVLVVNGKAFIPDIDADGRDNMGVKMIRENLRLHDITNAQGAYGLKANVNAMRQMAGMDLGTAQKYSWADYEAYLKEQGYEPTEFEHFKYEMGKKLDIGYHEYKIEADEIMSFDSASSIDEFMNKVIGKITDSKPFRVNGYEFKNADEFRASLQQFNNKTVFGEGFEDFTYENSVGKNVEVKARMFTTSTKSYTPGDIFGSESLEEAAENTKAFFGQFASGRNKATNEFGEYFTEATTYPWMILNSLSEGMDVANLGLSVDSKSSTSELLKNLLLKRALPIFGLTQIPGMINYFSEPFFGGEDENGNRDNITKFLMREVVRPIDIGAHSAMDLIGATKLFKFLGEMVPGIDQINEIPGIYHLGLGQTAEEREDYIENGYDPVRKGRWWGSGNTPFTGGKIMYFRPNLYRRIEADVDFSDSKWGSRQEYYNHTWYPNLVNPFAPINHFILDKHHYDKKHYHDRPYLQTAPVGSSIPIIGEAFAGTIGSIIAPPKKMHLEYWENGLQPIPGDEEPSPIFTTGRLASEGAVNVNAVTFDNTMQDMSTYQEVQQKAIASAAADLEKATASSYHAKEVVNRTMQENAGITFSQIDIQFPESETVYNELGSRFEVYKTPSGNLSIVDVPDELNLHDVNRGLKEYSINKVLGTDQRVTMIDDFQGPGIPVGNESEDIDNAFVYRMGEQFNNLADVAGLKGFGLQAFVTGEANENARIVEDSGYAYSFNRDFWEENLGGFGGNLSEIARRFIPQRNKNTEYVNPIRNTMPSWMPGSDYFTDFKHGDPYSKIDNGEERLPGQGYERLHNMGNIWDMNINSLSLGYSTEDTVMQILGKQSNDGNKNSKIHKQIIRAWKANKFTIDTNGEYIDRRNGINGKFDVMVYDHTSKTKKGIMDIKVVSAEELDAIRQHGQPLSRHRQQVNYELWATQNTKSNGYVYYVDENDLTNREIMKFKFNKKMLKDSLNTVYAARDRINKGIASGEISRGDLYSPLEKFRILADVAPYSQEFKDAQAALSMMNLSKEEEEEAKRIRERVTQQKEPLRVYDYKYKTSNLKTETVTVTDIIDNNTFVTKEYGRQHGIKFAGIQVSESSELYKYKYETYTDKAGRKRKRKVGPSRAEAAHEEIMRHIRPGSKIQIQYDADERNKYSKDSTESIRAVVKTRGGNLNHILLNKGLAKEKEDDNSPAAIHARYTKGEIAFGSAMERLTHDVISNIPFIGNKIMQVRSPYEQYRNREVYGKDFQSWNHPIRDILIPNAQLQIANSGVLGIMTGAFVGSMFGASHSKFGKLVGGFVGAMIPTVGKMYAATQTTKERDWRPKRRQKQEALNEYVDTLKYVKNMRLYEQYKIKAKKENHFDVDKYMKEKDTAGILNKQRRDELTAYKKMVKLDFKHRERYNFKYGKPKYVSKDSNKAETISAINKEIAELQSDRSVEKLPINAMKAIQYKQQAKATMYGYEPGDSLVNIMSALPKKDRQYFKHFMNAPEEEKEKILRIAPSYMRRALQSTWGMKVDKKPTLQEYFQSHALPDAHWVGWDESTNIDDVKVKMIHQNKLDPGEFDVWQSDRERADQVNIPVPNINVRNSAREVQARLNHILGSAGYENVQTSFVPTFADNSTVLNIQRDARNDVESQINQLEI